MPKRMVLDEFAQVRVVVADQDLQGADLHGDADSDRRAKLGRVGRARYEREFDIGTIAPRIERIYDTLPVWRSDEAWSTDRADSMTSPILGPEDEELAGESMHPRDRLLVVIPALNEADCIAEVIAQLRAQGLIDVVVVDDGSTDDTAAIAVAHGATVLRAPLWQGALGRDPDRHPLCRSQRVLGRGHDGRGRAT